MHNCHGLDVFVCVEREPVDINGLISLWHSLTAMGLVTVQGRLHPLLGGGVPAWNISLENSLMLETFINWCVTIFWIETCFYIFGILSVCDDVSCLAYSSTRKMEAALSSETSVDFQWITWRYISDHITLLWTNLSYRYYALFTK
jgi:hypothetical protein